MCTHMNHMEVRGQPTGVSSLLHPCGSWARTQVARLGGKHLCLLSHFADLLFLVGWLVGRSDQCWLDFVEVFFSQGCLVAVAGLELAM